MGRLWFKIPDFLPELATKLSTSALVNIGSFCNDLLHPFSGNLMVDFADCSAGVASTLRKFMSRCLRLV